MEEALGLWRDLGDRGGIARSLNNLGAVAIDQGDHGRAAALYEESLALQRGLGDKVGIAYSLAGLGSVAYMQGDYGRATALHQEALAVRRELEDKLGISSSLAGLGSVAYMQEDYSRATALLHEAMLLSRDIEAKYLMAEVLEPLVWSVVAQGQPELAARLGGAAEALRDGFGMPLPPEQRAGHDQALQAMCADLGEEAFAAAWAEGRVLPLDEAVALALAPSPDAVTRA
jgi:tetratricopeptide (TPR) repeat protein